jgi:hypothetical protein
MKQDDIWDFYISVAYRFLQVEQANTEETVSTLKSDADEIQNLGDRIESLLSEWHALHKPVKLPATWASVPSDIAALVDDHNARVSKVEKSLKDGSLALDSLAKLLGSKAQRDRVSRKIADMEGTVKELRQLLITLYRGGGEGGKASPGQFRRPFAFLRRINYRGVGGDLGQRRFVVP